MQNPSALYRFETDADLTVRPARRARRGPRRLHRRRAASSRVLGGHLLETGDPEVVASFDVDQLLDYRGRRPAMVFDTNRWVEYDDPAMLLHRLTDRDGQTYYLLTGPEPDYQWERVVEADPRARRDASASRSSCTRTASRWACRTPARSA